MHGFDAGRLPGIEERARTIDPIPFSFVGTTGWGFGPHDGRYYDLCRVLEKTDLLVFGNEPVVRPNIADRMPVGVRQAVRRVAIETLSHLPDIGLRATHRLGRYTTPVLMRAADAEMRRKKFGPEPPQIGRAHVGT